MIQIGCAMTFIQHQWPTQDYPSPSFTTLTSSSNSSIISFLIAYMNTWSRAWCISRLWTWVSVCNSNIQLELILGTRENLIWLFLIWILWLVSFRITRIMNQDQDFSNLDYLTFDFFIIKNHKRLWPRSTTRFNSQA